MLACRDIAIRVPRVMLLTLVVSFLFFYFNLFGLSVLFYLGLAGFAISVIALTEKEMFLLISFLIPNLFMFKQIDSESALLGYVIVLMSIKTLVLNFSRNIRINIFWILHIGFTLITCVIYSDASLLLSLVRFVFNFSFFTYCASLFSRDGEIKIVIKTYCVGIVIAILMGLIFHLDNGDLYHGFFGGINSGRNYFGAVVTPTITIVLLYFLEKRSSFVETFLYGITLALCMISVVLSNSRTSVISLVLPILMCLFCIIRVSGTLNGKIFSLILILSVIVFAVCMHYQDMILKLFSRFQQDDVQTGNERFVLWRYYISQTLRNPVSFLFGSGSKIENMTVEHNTFVQCFYQLGVLGLITILGVVQQNFKKIIKRNKCRFITVFSLLSVVFPFCGINGLYSDQLSYLLILSALIMVDFSKTKVTS